MRASTSDEKTINLSTESSRNMRGRGKGKPVVVGFTSAADDRRTSSTLKHFLNQSFCDTLFDFSEDYGVLLELNVWANKILCHDDTLPNQSMRSLNGGDGQYV